MGLWARRKPNSHPDSRWFPLHHAQSALKRTVYLVLTTNTRARRPV